LRSKKLNNQRKVYEHLLGRRKSVRVLDLGCGTKKFSPAYGVDAYPHPGVDVVADTDSYGLPFLDNSLDMVVANHFIEHVDDIRELMMEVHRILTPGGFVVLRTPYFAHEGSFRDPSHRWHLALGSMDYFLADNPLRWKGLPGYFEKVCAKVDFESGLWLSLGRLIYCISPVMYEKNFAHVFPGQILYWALRAIK